MTPSNMAPETPHVNPPTYYFAYGSNLSPTQMHQRCPNSSGPIGLAHLPSPWTWLINERGYANIVHLPPPAPTNTNTTTTTTQNSDSSSEGVYGLVYLLHPSDEPKLDLSEGVPWAYEKRWMEMDMIREEDGEGKEKKREKATLLVYIDFERRTPSTPKPEYVGRMNRGIEEAIKGGWGFPEGYVERVMRPFIPLSSSSSSSSSITK